jgi:hypothetical protein
MSKSRATSPLNQVPRHGPPRPSLKIRIGVPLLLLTYYIILEDSCVRQIYYKGRKTLKEFSFLIKYCVPPFLLLLVDLTKSICQELSLLSFRFLGLQTTVYHEWGRGWLASSTACGAESFRRKKVVASSPSLTYLYIVQTLKASTDLQHGLHQCDTYIMIHLVKNWQSGWSYICSIYRPSFVVFPMDYP